MIDKLVFESGFSVKFLAFFLFQTFHSDCNVFNKCEIFTRQRVLMNRLHSAMSGNG